MSARTRLGVLGWPVAHSRSPAMHNAAFAAVGLADWRYQLLPVPPELFEQTVRALAGAGFRGANVTIPHKASALALADEASERARAIGAANTLLFEPDGWIVADNTDAPSLIRALPFPMTDRTAMVLGAGGTARAAVWALRDAGAREVHIWNRTPARAEQLSAEFGAVVVAAPVAADVLVHCTSSGLNGHSSVFKQVPLNADDVHGYQCVVDFVYTNEGTELVRTARGRGVCAIDGLTLLVGQGALSFERFTGHPAPVAVMESAVRR
jgi:shikimate dehydrogenase